MSDCQECQTNQYRLRCEWLSEELATAREQNRQLVDTVRWLEAQINADKT